MHLNRYYYSSLRYGTIKPEQMLAIASENGRQTLALTDTNSTSTCSNFVQLSSKYEIKPILAMDFRNSAQQQFILIAQNNKGFTNITDYVSQFLQNSKLEIPEIAPQLEGVFVIYPYSDKKKYDLKENEFIGIHPKDLNHLKFSKWNSYRNKLVVVHAVSFQNSREFNSRHLVRAIDNNTLLTTLSKNEHDKEKTRMLPYQELSDTYNVFPELMENTKNLVKKRHADFEFSHKRPTSPPRSSYNDTLATSLSLKTTYDGLQNGHKKRGERVFTNA